MVSVIGVAAAIDAAFDVDLDGLDDASLHALVVAGEQLASRFDALRARAVSAWDGRMVWASDGSKSPGARLARDARCSPERARAEVHRARRLRSMPLTTAAYEAGQLSTDHVNQLVRANQDRFRHLFSPAEAHLVETARTSDVVAFKTSIQYWIDAAIDEITPEGTLPPEPDQYVRRAWTLDSTLDLQARLNGVTAAIVDTELERLEQELFHADWAQACERFGDAATSDQLARTSMERHVAALELMARRSSAMDPNARATRPLFSVLVGWETLKGRICELANGVVITPQQAADALTEADLERIVFDPQSRVLDVGRRSRFFTGGLRRALEIRDRTCTFPGCHVPAHRCQADHIVEWTDGGETSMDNGRLLCAAHNRQRPGRRRAPPGPAPPDPDDPDPYGLGPDPLDDEPDPGPGPSGPDEPAADQP